jgi:hypothetical protein
MCKPCCKQNNKEKAKENKTKRNETKQDKRGTLLKCVSICSPKVLAIYQVAWKSKYLLPPLRQYPGNYRAFCKNASASVARRVEISGAPRYTQYTRYIRRLRAAKYFLSVSLVRAAPRRESMKARFVPESEA